MGKEAELSTAAYNTEPSLRTQVKNVSSLAYSPSRICVLFREMSLQRNLHDPDSIQKIPHTLNRSEVSSLHAI